MSEETKDPMDELKEKFEAKVKVEHRLMDSLESGVKELSGHAKDLAKAVDGLRDRVKSQQREIDGLILLITETGQSAGIVRRDAGKLGTLEAGIVLARLQQYIESAK